MRARRTEIRAPGTQSDARRKRVIQRAAAVSGLSAADLAYEGARRILEEHERMDLTEADRKIFLKALLKPPKPTTRLLGALKRHTTEVE